MEPGRLRIHTDQGPLDVYPQLRLVRRGEREEAVRPKTFDVLLYLVRNRERVVTKEELLRDVWLNVAVTDDVLVRSVLEIRRLIGDDPKAPVFIRTVARSGYQFVGPVDPEIEAAPPNERRTSPRLLIAIAMVVVLLAAGFVLWRWFEPSRAHDPFDRSWEIAWWRFNEKSGDFVEDASGFRNRGKLLKGAMRSRGLLGGAVQLNGVDAFVEGLDPGRLPSGHSARTITAWIRATTTNGARATIFLYGSAAFVKDRFFLLALDETGRVWAGWNHSGIYGVRKLDDGEWHHVAVSYSGPAKNELRLFVDGAEDQLVKSARSEIPATELQSQWRIGKPFSGTAFRGEIADVRVFGRALENGELQAYYRCTASLGDISVNGTSYYFMPIFNGQVKIGRASQGFGSSVKVLSSDFSGIQFARSDGVCAGPPRGASVGSDLTIEADYQLPRSDSAITHAGPYFRSRAAAPSDGLIGGRSAGYWVQLTSRGKVKVFCLNPQKVVAFSNEIADFDSTRFHHLRVAAHGEQLEAVLDGNAIEFDQAGVRAKVVRIAPLWKAENLGDEEGAAGIAAASDPRAVLSGQEIRNLFVSVK